MAEENKTTKNDTVDVKVDEKTGEAKETFGYKLRHPKQTIKRSKEDHPVAWAVGGLVGIGALLTATYVFGRYSADKMTFEPNTPVEPEIPETDPNLIDTTETVDIPTVETETATETVQ